MQFQTPTIAGLVGAAIQAAKARTELLVLLGLLAGIGSSIVYAPAMAVVEHLFEIQQQSDGSKEGSAEFATAFNDGLTTLLLGHLAATAVSTFLLVPFARASAPGGLIPSAGGLRAFLIRGLRSFLHMVAVNGITILGGLFILSLTAGLALAMGGLANALAMVGGGMVIWMSIVLTSTAHLAIAAESRDRRETLPSAFMRMRLFLVPIVASLGVIFLVASVFYLTIGTLAVSLVPEEFETRMTMIVSGFVVYLASALHVAALYQVPDFRDLRPS